MALSTSQVLGQWGEDEAAHYLSSRGLQIIDRQFRQKWGELDLICRDGETWVFVEVKTRSELYQPAAIDAITPRKRRRVLLAAMSYMKWKRLQGSPMRFDVILIEKGQIEWIPDAFEIPAWYTC